MKKKSSFLLCWLLLCLGVFAGDGLVAVRMKSGVYLDGKLTDTAWKDAPEYTKFKTFGKETLSPNKTSVKILYDDDAIYFGIRCNEPNMKDVVGKMQPRDGGIYSNDNVEIMLDPAFGKERYYHFMVDVNGVMYDEYRDQGGGVSYQQWNGGWSAATFRGRDFWSVEIRIPFFNMAEKGNLSGTWGINVCRGRRPNPYEDSCIAGLYHNMNKYLPLTGLNTDLSSFLLEATDPACSIQVDAQERIFAVDSFTIGNFSGKKQELQADCWFVSLDGKVFTSPTTRFSIANGEVKKVTLPRLQLKKQGKYGNHLRICDTNGRILSYKNVISEVVFSPLTVHLQAPWYRHSIFETQKLPAVKFTVKAAMGADALKGKSLLASIVGADNKTIWSKRVSQLKGETEFIVPNDSKLPYGRHQIVAELLDANGKKVPFCRASFPLWKLPFHKTETWRDKDGNWCVEGKPIFINTYWGGGTSDDAQHNCIMTFRDSWKKLPAGKLAISGNTIFDDMKKPAVRKALQTGNTGEPALQSIYRTVKKDLDTIPNLFGHFLADEPSSFACTPEGLQYVYELMKSADPYHPVIVSDSCRNEYIYCMDINGHHPYPTVLRNVKINDCTTVATTYDSGMMKQKDSYHKTTFIFMHMGFNKWDFGLGSRDGRMATFDEFRNQTLMALACDMKGLIPFNSEFLAYPEGVIGFPAIAEEGKWLGQAVVAQDTSFQLKCDRPEMRYICRDVKGDAVIIASYVRKPDPKATKITPVKVTFSGLPKSVRQVQVVGEQRSIPVRNGSFCDYFAECDGHAYTTGKAPVYEGGKVVREKIEAAWRQRAKPGNLLFQRMKDDTVKIEASSAFVNYGHSSADTVLWHLCEGYVPKGSAGYGLTVWASAPKQIPAWVSFEMKKGPAPIGRIVVYPVEKSIQSIQAELFVNGQWKKVAEVADAREMEEITLRFAPETVSKFRLVITKLNDKPLLKRHGDRKIRARIGEVEAYSK